ncbi:uncharacterized protein [Battus philenor]|uniref:uncharacterized protein n=1 Tax=Battus philenor TaxID=42288 RepID=UPI0035D00DE2
MANEENENKGSGEHVLNRVAVKVPPFYAAKPKLWFATLESQFVLANITSDATKYHHAVSQLEPQYAEIVENIVEGPAATNKYETLKNELIKRLSASRERQVQQLLHHEELGDSKPSQFLRRLKSLAGSGVPDDLLRTLWASRLPSSVQPIIASQAKMTLDEVAELADQVLDVVSPTSQVAGISGTSSGGSTEIAALTRQVQTLTEKVDPKQIHDFKPYVGHLKDIPKRFEVKGENARTEFRKYINDINEIAKKSNLTVKYKVKVEVFKQEKKHLIKKELNKNKSKKYNVPLKKKNMKLSNFEMILRKHVESMAPKTLAEEDQNIVTTEKQLPISITKSTFIGKYKPVISHVRTNYSKIIRPVRNKIITLTM